MYLRDAVYIKKEVFPHRMSSSINVVISISYQLSHIIEYQVVNEHFVIAGFFLNYLEGKCCILRMNHFYLVICCYIVCQLSDNPSYYRQLTQYTGI